MFFLESPWPLHMYVGVCLYMRDALYRTCCVGGASLARMEGGEGVGGSQAPYAERERSKGCSWITALRIEEACRQWMPEWMDLLLPPPRAHSPIQVCTCEYLAECFASSWMKLLITRTRVWKGCWIFSLALTLFGQGFQANLKKEKSFQILCFTNLSCSLRWILRWIYNIKLPVSNHIRFTRVFKICIFISMVQSFFLLFLSILYTTL